MITKKISIEMARRLMLAAQGLNRLPEQPATKADLLAAIHRIGVLQIDTIHVVARSPYLVLWSRLGDYQTHWLDELLADGALFEYWAHAMCFIPIEDYPLYRRRMLDSIAAGNWVQRWSEEHPQAIERVRTHLRENGAVRSAEFENKNHKSSGWWDWKEEKIALEALHYNGELMIARRQNFQRVYDLRERVLSGWDDQAAPPNEEVQRELILRAVGCLGIAFPGWIPDYFRQAKKGLSQQIKLLSEEGLIVAVEVEGFNEPAYIHQHYLGLIEEVASNRDVDSLTTFLSPFDPLVWDRRRARELFNFDYTIECYTPAAKRRYGYFTLPILWRGQLIGRLDPIAHRSQGIFEVKALHLEPWVEVSDDLAADLGAALQRLADWHKTPELVIRKSDPPEMAGLVSK